eukprot:3519810-Heterocapsa_arctica.AAC.1
MPHEDRDFAVDTVFPDDQNAWEGEGGVAPYVDAVRDVDNAFALGSMGWRALPRWEQDVGNLLRPANVIRAQLGCDCPRKGPIVDVEVVEHFNDAEGADP